LPTGVRARCQGIAIEAFMIVLAADIRPRVCAHKSTTLIDVRSITGREQMQQHECAKPDLLDHLVGENVELRRNREP